MSFEWIVNRCYSWCPEDPKGIEHLALARWLREAMGKETGDWWLDQIDGLSDRGKDLRSLVREICRYDCPALVELLYPRCPALFLTGDGDGRSALDLCAYYGSADSLLTLLELGADPNGLDRDDLRSFTLNGEHGRVTLFWLTPLDWARATGKEECVLLLELYGGRPAAELSQTPPEELPECPALQCVHDWEEFYSVCSAP